MDRLEIADETGDNRAFFDSGFWKSRSALRRARRSWYAVVMAGVEDPFFEVATDADEILWDNDGVLVDTEGLYFRATQEFVGPSGVHLASDQFKEISLRRGESTFMLAAEQGIGVEESKAGCGPSGTGGMRRCWDQSPGPSTEREEVLRSLHGQVGMGVVTSRTGGSTSRLPTPEPVCASTSISSSLVKTTS